MTKQSLLLLALAVLGIAVFVSHTTSSPAPVNQSVQPELPNIALPEPPRPPEPPQPPADTLRPREQIAHGSPLRIHWALKLPNADERRLLVDGEYVFRDKRSFAEFLGPKSEQMIRWNNIDFNKQMAVVNVFQYPEIHTIDSIVRTATEIVVLIGVSHPRDAMPSMVRTDAIGAAINHSELPVRFSYFDVPQAAPVNAPVFAQRIGR